jgi:hypothetical protein
MKTLVTLLAAAALVPCAPAQTSLKTWPSPAGAANFGQAVALGDVNGDGSADVIVGDPDVGNGVVSAGAVRAWSQDGQQLLSWTSSVKQALGASIACVGDLDLDGCDDILAGATFNSTIAENAGAAFVLSGKNGAGLFTFYGSAKDDYFGYDVARVGDVNMDGRADLAVTSPFHGSGSSEGTGLVRVFSGANGQMLLNLTGAKAGEYFGISVDGAGDADGDGRDDLVIGISGHDSPTEANVGRVEVRSGADGHLIWGRDGVGDSYGYCVAGLGDVNGDGLSDVAVGAPFWNTQAGRAQVLLSPAGSVHFTVEETGAGTMFGRVVAGVGDVDKDGVPDLAATAPAYGGSRGLVRIHSGRTGQVLYNPLYGDALHDLFGTAVSGGGDLNGDGWLDIVVGAPQDFGGTGYVRGYDVLVNAPDLGLGGPGAAKLKMYGSPLNDFGQMDLALTDAAPGKPALFVASLAQLNLPWKGGVIVPNIHAALLVPVVTGPQGSLKFTGIPGGGGPASLFIQCLIKDPAQPKGWALSNAIKPHLLP